MQDCEYCHKDTPALKALMCCHRCFDELTHPHGHIHPSVKASIQKLRDKLEDAKKENAAMSSELAELRSKVASNRKGNS